VNEEREVRQVEFVDELPDDRRVVRRPVGEPRRIFREAEPEAVERDTAVLVREAADRVAVEERPPRVAVEHEQRPRPAVPRPLVDVVDGTGRETDTAGLEGVLVAVDPVRVPVVYGVETGPRTAEAVSVSISASPPSRRRRRQSPAPGRPWVLRSSVGVGGRRA
jgi:hypothetical protein